MSDESPPDSEFSSPFGPDPSEGPDPAGEPRRAQAARTRKGPRWGRIAVITFAVLFAVVAGAVGYFGMKLDQSVNSIVRSSSFLPTASRPPSASSSPNGTYSAMNILLIGSDSRGSDQGRSDSFIIMHISADRKSTYLVSFPRDMWVTIPGYGKNKINAGYSFGGPPLAVQTIESLTGARIDHVVVTNFSNFMGLVDTVGPFMVDNPVASVATDDHQHTYKFPKGPMEITDGYMALEFSRQRDELPRGDLDRTLRQRALLKGLALKAATPDVLANPVKLNDLISSIAKFVTVDAGMTNDVIISLGLSMTGMTSANQIHLVQAPITGFGTSPDGLQSIDVVDVAGNVALGKALQNDTMDAFVAAHPTTEYGYTPSPNPSASATKATSTKATAKATATTTKKK